MRSKANIKSHSIHPMLVGFPIAFFSATLFFDCLAFFQPQLQLRSTAWYLNVAGIVMAVLTAIPGIIDYKYTVPPESSAKKRAIKHGLLNSIVLLLFALVFYLRHNANTDVLILIGIEILAIFLMLIAGWMGGTLVSRNQIGIDIRYADAGKWNEAHIKTDSKKVAVANLDELKTNQMKLIHLNGKRIVIAKGESDHFFAFDDKCTHRGASLAAGSMICNTVQCPWHGSQFAVDSGAIKAGPAKENLSVYPLSVEGNIVYLKLSALQD